MTDPLRIGIVGAGNIATVHHVPAIEALGDAGRLVAVADIDPARAAAFAAAHGVPASYAGVEAMLAREALDLVHICTPPHTHAAHAIACLRAGATPWCEKPPVSSLAELDRIAAVEHDTGRACAYVFQLRFGSAARHVRELIAGGEIGAPIIALCQTTLYRDDAYYGVEWRGRWDTEVGGPTAGHGIHAIDLMLSLLGPWTHLRSQMRRLRRSVETEDVSVAVADFECGAVASVLTSVLSPDEESRLRIDLDRVTVELRHIYGYANADWRFTAPPRSADDELLRRCRAIGPDVPATHTAQLADLVGRLRGGEAPYPGTADVRNTMEFVTSLYKSALTCAPVSRGSIRFGDPFYTSMHGDTPGWAPVIDDLRDAA
jgi:predicted dehydrogenase